jgi:TRAP-type C4-dicarboxylate transport system permease large subunit
VGTSLFIAASIAKTDLQSATRHMTPFMIAVIIALVLVTYFPPVTLWFPDLIIK